MDVFVIIYQGELNISVFGDHGAGSHEVVDVELGWCVYLVGYH